jgi:prepilin-type N-terminal cleavage/methylation domain-containing protein
MNRKGFTIIEATVALLLLSVGAAALGTVLVRSSRTANAAASTVRATALINSEVSRLAAIPYDSLAAGTRCDSVATGYYPHIRCTVVSSISTKVREVTVIVTPTGNTLLRPDTVTFRRAGNSASLALNTP